MATTVISGSSSISNKTLTDVLVSGSNAYLSVRSSGQVVSATATANGTIKLFSGGQCEIVSLKNSGRLEIYSGEASKVHISSGGYLWINDVENDPFSDAFASATTVSSGGTMFLGIAGAANNTTVLNGGKLILGGNPSSYGSDVRTFTLDTVLSGGSMEIRAGASASTNHVSSGVLRVSSGGTAIYNKIESGGILYVSSGGSATSNYISGIMYVAGTASSNSVDSGGIVSAYYCAMNSTTVNSGGMMYVRSGGILNNTTVNSDGWVYLSSGGILNNTTVNSDGRVYLSSGGVVSNAVFNSGCRVLVSSGGKMTGSITVEDGAIVQAGWAVLDFNISEIGPGEASLVNNLSLLQHLSHFTLTVSGTQENGSYSLAGGVEKFDRTISVMNTLGEELGTLKAGDGRTNIDGTIYTLEQKESELTLTVEDRSMIPDVTKSDIDANGISDVMFQYIGGQGQIGFWMNGTDEWKSTNTFHSTDTWEVLGSYDMDANGKADSLLIGNAEVNGVRGTFVGYYADGEDTDENWVNISFLIGSEDWEWKNKVGNLTGNAGKNSIVWHSPKLGALGVWIDGTDEWVGFDSRYDGRAFELIGCGDFTGTGKDTIVMSSYNGRLFTIDLNGTTESLGDAAWSGWDVRAIADFAGDGKDDIVLFHKATGSMVLCADGNLDSYVSIGQLAADDWFIVGAGDYNGDKKDDLLVRQYSTGMLGYYVSGDTSKWVEMGRGVDMNWTVIA